MRRGNCTVAHEEELFEPFHLDIIRSWVQNSMRIEEEALLYRCMATCRLVGSDACEANVRLRTPTTAAKLGGTSEERARCEVGLKRRCTLGISGCEGWDCAASFTHSGSSNWGFWEAGGQCGGHHFVTFSGLLHDCESEGETLRPGYCLKGTPPPPPGLRPIKNFVYLKLASNFRSL